MTEVNGEGSFVNNFSISRRRKIFIVFVSFVVALILFGLVIVVYLSKLVATTAPDPNSLATREELLMQPNPPSNLTPTEIAVRQKLLDAPNPPSNLTPEEIKARQALMGKN